MNLVQLLYPARHCIFAVAYLDGKDTFVAVCNSMEGIVRETPLNRWCGICGSRDLRFEEKKTPWKTLAEAYPHLKAAEADNVAARHYLAARGQSIEPPIDHELALKIMNRRKS